MKYSTKDSHIPYVQGVEKKNSPLGSIMIIRISVALEKIQEKEQMLEDLLSQYTWAGVGRRRKRGKNKAQFIDG